MALNRPSNNMSTVAVMVAVLLLASQITPSHSTLTGNRRYLLQSSSATTASTAKAGMIEGTVTPTEGGVPGAEDVRPTNPSHSPGIGHAFTNNKIGRKLLAKAEGRMTSTSTGIIEGTITPTEGGGNQGATEDVRPTNPSHSPGIGHAFTNNKIGRKLLLTASQW